MTSGKQSRRKRRVQAPPPVGPVRRASPRVVAGAAAALVLAAGAIAGVGLALRGGMTEPYVPARGSLQDALPGARDVAEQVRGIPQDGRVLGRGSAPVSMVEYVDVQCPFCRVFAVDVLPRLVERYVRPGTLRLEIRPLAFIGPDSERGRAAALAAGRQDRMFELIDLLFYNQGPENSGWLDEEMVAAAAASVPGLAVPELLAARRSDAVQEEARALERLAAEDGVEGTPTVLVGRTGGRLLPVELGAADDPAPLEAAIERLAG